MSSSPPRGRVLITGSRGFIGRHFSAELRRAGFQVVGCDISDGYDVFALFRRVRFRFDLVVHAAAMAPHRAAIEGQPKIFAYNSMLDAAMFEWAMRTEQPHVLYFSSSAAYSPTLRYPYIESDINLYQVANPDASYGWTKLTGERMAQSARQAGVTVSVVRPFSGYGSDQGESWPFGAFVARAKRREDPFVIWGDGKQVRDWIHVNDLVKGALATVFEPTTLPVNLCTGIGTSMSMLAKMVCMEVGYSPEFHTLHGKPAGVPYRVGNPDLMSKFHTAEVTLADGVRRAVRGEEA